MTYRCANRPSTLVSVHRDLAHTVPGRSLLRHPHLRIIREIDHQASADLLRTVLGVRLLPNMPRDNSRLIVDGGRPNARPISRTPPPAARRQLISTRSANDNREIAPTATGTTSGITSGITPPASRNHRHATVFDTPATRAASSSTSPSRIPDQNRRRTSTGNPGRPRITPHLTNRCCVDRLNPPGSVVHEWDFRAGPGSKMSGSLVAM
jgi:hypothetical protein